MNRMKRFEVLIGVWNTTGEVFASGQSPATVLSATDTYRWLSGGHFIVHEVDARLGDQVSRSMEVLGYDAASKKYLSRSYDDRGVSEAFEFSLTGRRLKILGEMVRFAGQFSPRSDALRGLWELKNGSSWKPWMKIVLARA